MQNHRELNRERWLRHVKAVKSSGQSISAYCREHGLSRPSLDNWLRKVRSRRVSIAPSAFIRAEVVTMPSKLPDAKWVAAFVSHFLEVRS